jgi:hypothetical protein
MGFSKYDFRPIGSLQYIGGVFDLDSAGEASEGHCLDYWSRTHANFDAPLKLIFSAIFQL